MSHGSSDSAEEDMFGDTSEESVVDSDSSSDFEESSSEESGDDEGQDVHGVWLPIIGEDPGPQPINFTAAPGPKHPPTRDARPVDYVNLFFTPAFVDQIVMETNRYARKWIKEHGDYLRDKARSAVHQWIKKGDLTQEEFRAFLGVTINMGLIRKPNINLYWESAHPSQLTPWFIQHFSRERFKLLLRFLHFSNDKLQPPIGHPNHKLHKIRSLIDHFTRAFLHHYHPGKDISIDESMVAFKGKTPNLKQYMPLKRHARYGIKLWCVCDSRNGYTSYFEVYKGKDPEGPVQLGRPRGTTHALVMRLLTECNFLHRGHHLGVDNYFSSPDLFLELYAHGTTATGTVRTHRRGLPRTALKQRLKNKEVAERRKGPLLCVSYQDGSRRPVLLSTAISAGFQNVRNRRGVQMQKPKVVVRYNESMGGVDLSDAKLYTYLAERRTMKWTLKVAFSLFGRAVLNSYIIYEQNTTDMPKLTRQQFMVEVVEALAGNYYPPKVIRHRRTAAEIIAARQDMSFEVASAVLPQPQPALGGGGHELTKLPVGKKRNCMAGHNKRVRSSFECPACDIGLCPGCFVRYHR